MTGWSWGKKPIKPGPAMVAGSEEIAPLREELKNARLALVRVTERMKRDRAKDHDDDRSE